MDEKVMTTTHAHEAYQSYQSGVRGVVLRRRAQYRKLCLSIVLAYSRYRMLVCVPYRPTVLMVRPVISLACCGRQGRNI